MQPIVFRFEQSSADRPLHLLGHTFDNALVTLELQPGQPATVKTVTLQAYVGAKLVHEETFPDAFSQGLVETLLRSHKNIDFTEIVRSMSDQQQRPD